MQLLLGILPLIAFYVVDSWYGLRAGVGVAMGFGLLDVGVGWLRTRRLNKMALFSAGLVLVLGSLSLLSDNESFILWSPVIGDAVFAALLVGSLAMPVSILELAWSEANPEEPLDEVMRQFVRGLTVRFALNLLLHAAITGWSTTQGKDLWIIVSGPVQYAMFGIQIAFEALLVWRLPPRTEPESEPEQSRP